jgi:hypothetical protein
MLTSEAKLSFEAMSALGELGFDCGTTANRLCVVQVVYGAERRLIDRYGIAVYDKLRHQFVENLSNALGDYARVVATQGGDFVVVEDEDRASLPDFLSRAFIVAEEALCESLMPVCRVLETHELPDAS